MALVALRFAIGWHFVSEGVSKLRDPKPFSAFFFGAAKGPLARTFQNMAWDSDGYARLNRKLTWEAWDGFREEVVSVYGFDEEQTKRAKRTLDAYVDQLDGVLVDERDEIDTYFRGLKRRDENLMDPARQDVPSLKGQSDKIEAELKKTRGPWFGQIDKLWVGLERDLNSIATPEQSSRGPAKLTKPLRGAMDSELIDRIIPYFDLTVGICLILGLFTPIAAWAGVAFLASVLATQPPWFADAAPTYYQTIEALALAVVATAGAGRHASLDFIFRALRTSCCPPKTGTPI